MVGNGGESKWWLQRRFLLEMGSGVGVVSVCRSVLVCEIAQVRG